MIASSIMTLAAVVQFIATLTLRPGLLIAGRALCALCSPLSDAALILYLQVFIQCFSTVFKYFSLKLKLLYAANRCIDHYRELNGSIQNSLVFDSYNGKYTFSSSVV